MTKKLEKDFLCNQAVEYILTQPVENLANLTVAEIARHLDVSHSYLARKFKAERDYPLREYLFREKMIRSVYLLQNEENMTIRDLARMMGFFDAEYFAYLFKQHFGVSPGRYRSSKKRNIL